MKRTVYLALIACVAAVPAVAAEAELEVDTLVFCTAVDDRVPVGEASAFDNDVGRVCCFTKIAGAQDSTTVFHVWYHGDDEMARVELAVNSASWRTWSTKRMLPSWTGAWRVEVQTKDGTVLESSDFTLRPSVE